VFEIICKFPVTQADAKAACQGYTDHVTLPPVGSHVRIVGRYVQDTFHAKWMEIHPATSITVVPQTIKTTGYDSFPVCWPRHMSGNPTYQDLGRLCRANNRWRVHFSTFVRKQS
jgi:hypothetical protein